MESIVNYDIPDGLYFGVINRRNWSYYNSKDGFSSRKKIDNLEFLFSTGFQYEGEYILCYCRGEVNEEDYTDYRVGECVMIEIENKKIKNWKLWRDSEYYNKNFEYYQ